MNPTTRILKNQTLIMNALAVLMHVTPGGDSGIRDDLWREANDTGKLVKQIKAEIADAILD